MSLILSRGRRAVPSRAALRWANYIKKIAWKRLIGTSQSVEVQGSGLLLDLQQSISPAVPTSELKDIWQTEVLENKQMALFHRSALYDEIRSRKAFDPWQLDVLGQIPSEQTLLSDYMFAVDVLISQQEWGMIQSLITDLAASQPVYVEVIYGELISRAVRMSEEMAPVGPLFEVFIGCFSSMGSNIGDLDRLKDRPFIEALKLLVSTFPQKVLGETEELIRANPPIGSSLATSILKILSTYKNTDASKDISRNLWEAKLRSNTATADDLYSIMIRQIYLGSAEYALNAYDTNPNLQRRTQADALLLATARSKDWDRLQAVFENLTENFQDVLKSQHYAIILQALGHLGGRNLLDGIFERYTERELKPTRGVYHAMIHSYRLMGDVKMARHYFDLMLEAHVEPTRITFQLLLLAYKDANDLPNALDLVHFASSEYQLPVTNKEVTSLLSICANRRDLESTEKIYSWAVSLLGDKVDRITRNAYMSALVECNQYEKAMEFYSSFENPGLDTLTILLSFASRWRLDDQFRFLLLERERLGLRADSKWYGTVMTYYSLSRDTARLFEVFDEMKAAGIRPTAGHYSIILDHLTKMKDFKMGETIVQEVTDQQVTPTFTFYEQWFRMMTLSTEPSSRNRAYRMLSKILDMGVFDVSSTTVPRDAAPPGVFKAVVRKLLKDNRFDRAYTLLARASKQSRNSEPWKIAALFMEFYDASGRYEALGAAWARFLSALRPTFVPVTSAEGQVVYHLPKRYRFNYWRQINIRITDLARQSKLDMLLSLERDLSTVGICMSSENLNHCSQTMLTAANSISESEPEKALALQTKAFDIAESRLVPGYFRNMQRRHLKSTGKLPKNLDHGNLQLSRKSIAILASNISGFTRNLAYAKKLDEEEAQELVSQQFPALLGILRRATDARERRSQAEQQRNN